MSFNFRKQYRLPYYNYASSGLYFITICADRHACLFGDVGEAGMRLSPLGDIVVRCWEHIPASSPYASIDAFVVMPNHVHGIVLIDNPDEPREITDMRFEPRKRSLSVVVRNFKAAVSIRARETEPHLVVWQQRFFDRIIRNERELLAVRKYIADNPRRWYDDRNHPDNVAL